MRLTKQERAEHILDIARSNTGAELRLIELAERCGRSPGQGFSRDLALARHYALDVGERITECYWSADRRELVLIHLHPGAEGGKGIQGLTRHGSDVHTRARTLRRHAAWETVNAEDPLHRKVAGIAERMGAGAEAYGDAFQEMVDLLSEMRAQGGDVT